MYSTLQPRHHEAEKAALLTKGHWNRPFQAHLNSLKGCGAALWDCLMRYMFERNEIIYIVLILFHLLVQIFPQKEDW